MKSRDVIRALEADGRRQVRSRISRRQFRHPTKPGKVSVPMHGSRDLGIEVIRSIGRQSGLKLWR